jgi:hypothetical protein
MDEGAPDELRTIYSTDVISEMGGGQQSGIDEIVAGTVKRRGEGFSGPGTNTRHFVMPVHVTVDGESATAVSYFLFLGDTSGVPVIKLFGVYTDRLVRSADGWRITHRATQRG